jgi:CDP-diacylglycerol---serine O-phosphatidyltransferase
MNIIKHIPNFITCLNLLCGCIGIAEAFHGRIENASYLIFTACILDFIDGFAARLLNASSPIGKELDSLADVVSFGVLPGVIMYHLLHSSAELHNLFLKNTSVIDGYLDDNSLSLNLFSLTGFIIPVFSALRLAKFNIDTRQTEEFIGVPTPANAIFIASLPLVIDNAFIESATQLYNFLLNPYFLIATAIVTSLLLVSPIRLIALKFRDFSWTNNKARHIFLLSSMLLLVVLKINAVPLIIILYIVLSVINNLFRKELSVNIH